MRGEPQVSFCLGVFGMLNQQRILCSILLVVTVVSFACGDSGETVSTASPPQDSVSPATPGTGEDPLSMPATWTAESLESLMSWFPEVIVGRVERLAEVIDAETTMPSSVYDVSVEQVIVSYGGGIGETIIFEQGGDESHNFGPLPVVGQTYLFFLLDLSWLRGEAHYTGPFFARFAVDSNNLVVPNGWERVKGIAAVSGVSAEEMGDIITGSDDPRLALLAKRTVDDVALIVQEAATRVTPAPTRTPIQTPVPSPTPGASPVP